MFEHHLYYDRHGNPIDRDLAVLLMENPEARRVARDIVWTVEVSTVHLVINHQFGNGPPLIFETMIFGGEHGDKQWRYHTEEQAIEGHRQVVAWLRGEGKAPDGTDE